MIARVSASAASTFAGDLLRGRTFGCVLAEGDKALDRPVVQRLGETSAFALLCVENL